MWLHNAFGGYLTAQFVVLLVVAVNDDFGGWRAISINRGVISNVITVVPGNRVTCSAATERGGGNEKNMRSMLGQPQIYSVARADSSGDTFAVYHEECPPFRCCSSQMLKVCLFRRFKAAYWLHWGRNKKKNFGNFKASLQCRRLVCIVTTRLHCAVHKFVLQPLPRLDYSKQRSILSHSM